MMRVFNRAFLRENLMPTYRAAAIADSTLERAYGHAIHKAFYELPNVELTALADPVAEPRAERAAEIGNPKQYDDYRDMLAAESPDLVAICPHHFKHHGRWLLDVIESGAKGIYIEKPITASLDEADAVLAAADAAGTKIAVAHQNRYRLGTRRVAQLVAAGDIGTLRYMRGIGKCDQRGGTHDLRVLGTHVLDALRYIAGDVVWATGHMQVKGRDVEVDDIFDGPEGLGQMAGDALTGYFTFKSGAVARFDSYTRPAGGPSPWFGYELWGDAGGISVRDGGRSILRYPDSFTCPATSRSRGSASTCRTLPTRTAVPPANPNCLTRSTATPPPTSSTASKTAANPSPAPARPPRRSKWSWQSLKATVPVRVFPSPCRPAPTPLASGSVKGDVRLPWQSSNTRPNLR